MKGLTCSFIVSLFVFGLNVTDSFGQKEKPEQSHSKWTTNPFDHQVFIENQGQFDGSVPGHKKILFAAQLGYIWAYFTVDKIVYSYSEQPLPEKKDKDKDKDPDAGEPAKPIMHYLTGEWKNSDKYAEIEPSDVLSNYYTYPKGSNSTIKANVFHKITYKNIYPGIDIEYSFQKGKDGIKYSIIVHPGADISNVGLIYSGAKELKLNLNGTVTFNSKMGLFTDHTPVSYYSGESAIIPTSYLLSNNEESFAIKEYDKTKTLIIDPWTTNPNFSHEDRAYDLDWDYNGNVYAYGGSPNHNTLTLVKMNNAGTIQWTYTASWGSLYYGSFCTDKATGTCYVGEGAGAGKAVKVNTAGSLVATFAGNPNLNELWRMKFDQCHHDIVIAGGTQAGPYSAGTLDTSMTAINAVNSCSTTSTNIDMVVLAIDPSGANCYMATSNKVFNTPPYEPQYSNKVMQLPLSALAPATYMVSDGYAFNEVGTVNYVGTNAMNGAAASPNWLYLYNADTLKKFNKNTGALISQYRLSTSNTIHIEYGGLDADRCDNVYVGIHDSIYIFNSSLSILSKTKMQDTVYSVSVGEGNTLYACGAGFVSALLSPLPNTVTVTTVPTSCSACNGSATATQNCGTGPFSYLWSNGATTQTATGLCTGSYTVTVTDSFDCEQRWDTAIVNIGNSAGFTVSVNSVNPSCATLGNATATPNGGTTPYTYAWNNGQTNQTATGLTAGSYTCTVKDNNGCIGTVSVTLVNSSGLTVTATSTNPACATPGSATANPSGGTAPYTYLWNDGQTNQIATGLTAGSYTCVVQDNNGCNGSVSVTLVNSSTFTSTATTVDPTCSTTGSITAVPSGGTPPYTYAWNNGQTSQQAINLTTGTYSCTITDNTGCSSTASATLVSSGSLTLNACCNDTLKQGDTVHLSVSGANTYAWDPPTALSCSDCPDPAASPTVTTTYTVTGTSSACQGIATLTLFVEPTLCGDFIPDAFSPNGDGLNDTFGPKGACMVSYTMYIFDRWGTRLFSTNTSQPWNGTINGNVAQEDIYIYQINTIDIFQQVHYYVGKVAVIK